MRPADGNRPAARAFGMQRQHAKAPMTAALPLPPEHLRVTVGPFSDPGLFARSGDDMVE